MRTATSWGGRIIAAGSRLLPVGAAIVGPLVLAAGASATPASAERLAVVFPPWWGNDHILAAAASAGDVVGVGSVPFILILRGDGAGLDARARRAGGLLLLDPAAAGPCAPPLQEPRP
jgi:hypothetical protein